VITITVIILLEAERFCNEYNNIAY